MYVGTCKCYQSHQFPIILYQQVYLSYHAGICIHLLIYAGTFPQSIQFVFAWLQSSAPIQYTSLDYSYLYSSMHVHFFLRCLLLHLVVTGMTSYLVTMVSIHSYSTQVCFHYISFSSDVRQHCLCPWLCASLLYSPIAVRLVWCSYKPI